MTGIFDIQKSIIRCTSIIIIIIFVNLTNLCTHIFIYLAYQSRLKVLIETFLGQKKSLRR
jgi:hypothetical protein